MKDQSKHNHYSYVKTSTMTSQIISLTIVYSTVYSGTDKKYRSSTLLTFVREIHRWSVNSLHKGPVMRKMFSFDDVIMYFSMNCRLQFHPAGNLRTADYDMFYEKTLTHQVLIVKYRQRVAFMFNDHQHTWIIHYDPNTRYVLMPYNLTIHLTSWIKNVFCIIVHLWGEPHRAVVKFWCFLDVSLSRLLNKQSR